MKTNDSQAAPGTNGVLVADGTTFNLPSSGTICLGSDTTLELPSIGGVGIRVIIDKYGIVETAALEAA